MLFKEIVGHQAIKQRLINSVKENRVSHAQMFLGPEGSGNLALAIAYAQYLSCEQKGEDDSCGHCSSCTKYSKLVHPDMHFVYPVATTKEVSSKPKSIDFIKYWRSSIAENPYMNINDWYENIGMENKQGIISVEDASEILRKLSLKAFESEYKVMLIWLPEKLRTEAANALLKILEEPPVKTLFLLVAENQDQIIRTILSRTQIIKIGKLSDHEVLSALNEKFDMPTEELKRIVHLADGNFREALIIAQKEHNADQAETFQNWMRLCYRRDYKSLIGWGEVMSKTGREKQKNFLSYALFIVRECLLLNYASPSLIRVDGNDLSFIEKFKAFIHINNCDDLTESINQAIFHIERNANPKILFLDLSIKISRLLQVK